MARHFFENVNRTVAAALFSLLAGSALAEPKHGIAMYGEPALPPDLVSLPYVNPEAPKGGSIAMGLTGSFDSMNPFITAGRPAEGVSTLVVETLMTYNRDEPFTLYGLLAESIETDSARTWVEFTLRDEARFSDGTPVTVEDVLWSFETLGSTKGNPRYHAAWKKVAKAEITGPGRIRFTFNTEDRELPLILGLRPILKRAQWENRDFEATSFDAPIGSGPYVVDQVVPGSHVIYRRNPDWWGKDLPINRGLWNFDEIRFDWFATAVAHFEAFKAGAISTFREVNPARWADSYAFPAVVSGDVVKAEIPHHRPSGIEGLAFNTRRPLFADWRVREALILAYNFEYINQTRTHGIQPRIESYFSNSPLGMTPGTAAEGRVAGLLEPFADALPPGAISGYALPVADAAQPISRANLRKASALLEEAGWVAGNDGILRDGAGQPFRFEIALTIGQDEFAAIAAIYVEALKNLGIEAEIRMLDSAEMQARTKVYDFDMTHYIRSLTLSPGNEQTLYWGSGGVTAEGTRNWPGINSPAVDALIAGMVKAPDTEDFTAHVQALDRVLTAGRYVIPNWYSDLSRIAHRKELRYPAHIPLYGDWPGFQPDTWWYQE